MENVLPTALTRRAARSQRSDQAKATTSRLGNWATIGACVAALLLVGFFSQHAQSQSVNGQLTGTITDPGGAIVPGVQVTAVNQGTGETRTAVTNDLGVWLIPQLPPATYKVTAVKQGFATVVQSDVLLNVNGSVTLNFKLTLAATSVTIQVNTAPPMLDTTSATISTIVGHQEVVDLPLNGRQFTQLALLSPGAAPVEAAQQPTFAIPEGGGGISPSTDGQRGQENNFTLDGIENNQLFDNAWAIAPPPDAIQEFNVQAHMTDAQFGVDSGANINVQTRAGSNSFHGDAWEFVRNADFDALTYPNFIDATHPQPFYHQNQYGFYVGGPVIKNHTFFSGYWEGYRFSQASAITSNTLTTGPNGEISGNFSNDVGTTPLATLDPLCRPTYQYELYDATTSRTVTALCATADGPVGSSVEVRDPFPAATGTTVPGTQVPSSYINSNALLYINAYYPAPNFVAAGGAQYPNFEYSGTTLRRGDQFGARFDQQLGANDSAFVRLARNNLHGFNPGPFPTVLGSHITNFADEVELGYTHIFNPKTILNIRAAYVYEVLIADSGDTNDPKLTAAMGTQEVNPPRLGANVPIFGALGNGVTEVANVRNPLGPSTFYQYNVDFSRTMGHHTVSVGGMFYPLRQIADVVIGEANAAQAGTSVDGTSSGKTGYGPASFLAGIVDDFYTYNLIRPLDLTMPWWAFYGQDQWQVNRKLVLSFGTRWDYIGTDNYHRTAITFDPDTGKMWQVGSPITVPTSFLPVGDPTLYQSGQGFSNPNPHGWEPRFGATYEIEHNTVGHLAFAIIDQHDNQLTQGNENLALDWPNGDAQNLTNLDIGVPTVYLTSLPTAASLSSPTNPSFGEAYVKANPLSYVEEYNAGIQQQLANNLSLNLDYVGSVGRHQWFNDYSGNSAITPGPGNPQLRAQYPQYHTFDAYGAKLPTSYNALQAKLIRPFAAGVTFTASYTWSKSMDIESDPYGNQSPDWYNPRRGWGPSDYNIPQIFVFSGVYQLPFGTGRQFMQTPNKFVQEVLGGWQTAGILSLHSGLPEWVGAGGDVANTNSGFETAERGTLSPYHQSGGGASGFKQWLAAPTPDTATALPSTPYAFTQPLQYTYGNERRNDLLQPDYKDVDFSLEKHFPLWESVNFQFRSEFFNIFNHTNYGGFNNNILTPLSFGQITSSNGLGRVIQLSGKIDF